MIKGGADMSHPTDKLQTIAEFLGEKRVDDLKDYVLAELKSDFSETIKEYYVVTPSEFKEAWDEMLIDVAKSITKKYKGEIKTIAEKAVEDKLAELKKEVD